MYHVSPPARPYLIGAVDTIKRDGTGHLQYNASIAGEGRTVESVSCLIAKSTGGNLQHWDLPRYYLALVDKLVSFRPCGER